MYSSNQPKTRSAISSPARTRSCLAMKLPRALSPERTIEREVMSPRPTSSSSARLTISPATNRSSGLSIVIAGFRLPIEVQKIRNSQSLKGFDHRAKLRGLVIQFFGASARRFDHVVGGAADKVLIGEAF